MAAYSHCRPGAEVALADLNSAKLSSTVFEPELHRRQHHVGGAIAPVGSDQTERPRKGTAEEIDQRLPTAACSSAGVLGAIPQQDPEALSTMCHVPPAASVHCCLQQAWPESLWPPAEALSAWFDGGPRERARSGRVGRIGGGAFQVPRAIRSLSHARRAPAAPRAAQPDVPRPGDMEFTPACRPRAAPRRAARAGAGTPVRWTARGPGTRAT